MYNKIIIFSGPYPIDQLGATRTIDVNLAKSLTDIGYNVTLIACGNIIIPKVNFIEIRCSRNFSFFNRGLNKIGFKNYLKLKRNHKIDLWVSSYLKTHKGLIDKKTVFLGRAAMSIQSFAEAKRQGALILLHSSWMHPFKQQSILNKEYIKLGIRTLPIPKSRIKIQLSEIRIADKIWCISRLVYDSYINNGINPEKLLYVPLGVNINDYKITKAPQLVYTEREKNFVILFVGTVNFEKGAHLLLEAIKRSKIENVKVIFNGSLARNFTKMFTEYKAELLRQNIQIKIDPGDPRENYLSSSVFVLPSIHESFGLVVLEAMASGLPVIISDNVGARDCVVDKKTGFIFESHNIEQLKDKIEFFYYNRSEIKIQGQNAAAAAQKYDWINISKKFKKELDKI